MHMGDVGFFFSSRVCKIASLEKEMLCSDHHCMMPKHHHNDK